MITMFSGTPGSGKSLHMAKDIMFHLRSGRNVVANFEINLDVIKAKHLLLTKVMKLILNLLFMKKLASKVKFERKIGMFTYVDPDKLTVSMLVKYARLNHKIGREKQTYLYIDESAKYFNPREFQNATRGNWIKLFQMHRKLGFEIILVAHNDRFLDRQIRGFLEYDVKHRKANNFGNIGLFMSIFRVKLFACVNYWYGNRERISVDFIRYKKLYSKIYDTYLLFDEEAFMSDAELVDFMEEKKKRSKELLRKTNIESLQN